MLIAPMPSPDLLLADVAELARLELSAEEIALYRSQLAQVLGHVAGLQELDLKGVEASPHLEAAQNLFRQDEVRPSLTQEEALRHAPRAANDLFIVPKVIE